MRPLDFLTGRFGKAARQEALPTKLEYIETPSRILMTQYAETDGGEIAQTASVDLAASYTLGNAFVLENSERGFQRTAYDQAKGKHVFQELSSGETITVLELRYNSEMKGFMKKRKPSDKLLALYWLEIDTSLGLPKGREIQGEIETINGVTYALSNAVYTVNGKPQPVSAAVCRGQTLLIFGNASAWIGHLFPS